MDGVTVSPQRSQLLGIRVSWGSLLAGALTTLAVSAILTILGAAIVLVAMKPDQLGGAMVALTIIRVSVVLFSAALGGLVAGYLAGTGKRNLGALHGFFSWCAAFMVSIGFSLMVFGAMMRVSSIAVGTAVTATAQAAGGSVAAGGNVGNQAVQFLEGLGYSSVEANRMVREAQMSMQRTLRGEPGAMGTATPAATMKQALNLLGGTLWLYWATWFLSMLLSAFSGGLGTLAARRMPMRAEYREPLPEGPPPVTPPPLRPQEV